MKNFNEPFDDTEKTFSDLIVKLELSNVLTIKILVDNNAKKLYSVSKANDILSYLTDNDVIIVLNENIFTKLSPEQQIMVAEEALACIGYDFENDRLVMSKPDVVTFSGILKKYSYNDYEVLIESIKSAMSNVEAEEDESESIVN
jgi:hypothetical protein